MQDYLMIGEVLKPQGVRGECKIKPCAADPELFRRWRSVFLEDHGAYTPLPLKLSRIHDGFVYAVLGECASVEDAERLRGAALYIDRKHAAKPEKGGHYIADLIGCEATDENGQPLGILTDVLQYGTVDTWVFRAGSGKTVMVPALLSVFPEVCPEEKRISVLSGKLQEVAVFED